MLKIGGFPIEGAAGDGSQFLAEASLMKQMNHGNILKLYALVTRDNGPTLIVTEFMCHGNLVKYLKYDPIGRNVDLHGCLDIALQVQLVVVVVVVLSFGDLGSDLFSAAYELNCG